MQRCPVCRATSHGASTCRRCGADLSTLLNIEQQAENLLRQAVQLWVAGETRAAGKAARHSLALKVTPVAEMIALFAQGQSGDSPFPKNETPHFYRTDDQFGK